ncbi:Flp family type IVb pilin [Mesorhizobium sp. SP-1A]|uniref:Flp family type IVb pilin n=1 Tax=Mesorhizobium sp. SP-1A TaxID=3077840 RepID=UPI0028F70942|nr:Flp family type IVb pilin [Mesorhizobium sp. SP-1A]
MATFITKLIKDERGATAIEYGLIAGLIAVVIITSVGLIGNDLRDVFQNIANTLPAPN